MDPFSNLLMMGSLLFVAMFAGIPIYTAFLVCNLFGVMLFMGTVGLGLFANSMVSTVTNPSFLALPLFILMGEVLNRSNAVDDLVSAVNALLGRFRSRQFVLSLVVSTILGTVGGSAMANAAMLSRTIFPIYQRRGYDTKLGLATIMGGACLAPIIPPSSLAIIVATLAHLSVRDLFLAGFLPGLLIATMLVCYVLLRVWWNPALAPSEEEDQHRGGADIRRALLRLLPFCLVVAVVVASITLGIATPSESGAVGVVGALLYGLSTRRLTLSSMRDAVSSTTTSTTIVLAIMASSALFTQLLAFSGLSGVFQQLVSHLEFGPMLMLFLLMAIPFLLCMFIDEIAAMLILIPIYLPLLPMFGFDPLWFWTLFLINMTLGAIAPPVGYVLFVMQGVIGNVTLKALYSASLPVVAIYLLAMLVIAMFPQIVTIIF